jgi:transposase-like protein
MRSLLKKKKKKTNRIVHLRRSEGSQAMEKTEKAKLERTGVEERRGRKTSVHTAQEKCRAVLSVWTERRKPGEVCRELGVAWAILSQWQARAMEGMLSALQPRVSIEKTVALSPRLAVLLEQKSRAGSIKKLDQRLARLQAATVAKALESREVTTEKKP